MAISENIKKFLKSGNRLNDDSINSEKILQNVLSEKIKKYFEDSLGDMGTIVWERKISLYDCLKYFDKTQKQDEKNKKVYMKPDGGIFFLKTKEDKFPLLVCEDKRQGTNDLLFFNGSKRQATGNAVERAAKNIRMSEMLFSNYDIFPYVIFASGCDFHPSESIAKRLEAMNYGVPNHEIVLGEKHIVKNDDININLVKNKCVASIFVKSHKFNEMQHGASCWKSNEIHSILENICGKVCVYIKEKKLYTKSL
jgi:hypothetical protein